jgi:alanine racemase
MIGASRGEREEGSVEGIVAEAVVDLDAIAHNVALLAERALMDGDHPSSLMAVVKADAFGHGIIPVSQAALKGGASWLGVTSVEEALAVRGAGIDAPMLAWLYGTDDDFVTAIEAGVDLSVSSVSHLDSIVEAAEQCGRPALVHLKIDTGLTRNGVRFDDWPDLVRQARVRETDGTVRVHGIWSHLASADDPGNPSVPAQLAAFDRALEIARDAGLDPDLRHLANSAGILDVPQSHFDLVRAGIALYGVEPIDGRDNGLRRAMTLRGRAVNVKRVGEGTGVSYMHEYITPGETTVVLVPLGYADGVPRRVSNRGQVLIRGHRCRIAGRVAMDQFVVDAGDLPVELGDPVVLFGPGDNGEPTVQDWAAWAETNPHEILTGIGSRVPRHYLPIKPETLKDLEQEFADG